MKDIKLEVGQVFKIKDIGILLGEQIPSKIETNKKKKWLKTFSQYCEWREEGRKIIVEEVFTKEKQREDNRINNGKNIYIDDMALLLHNYATKTREKETTIKNLAKDLGLINQDFINNNLKVIAERINRKSSVYVNTHIINNFNQIAYKKFTDSIITALNKLQKQGKIIYSIIPYIQFVDEKIQKAMPSDVEMAKNCANITLQALHKEGVIRKPIRNCVYTQSQRVAYDRLYEQNLLEYNIEYFYRLIKIEVLEEFTLDEQDLQNCINSLKDKFRKTIEEKVQKIKSPNKAYNYAIGEWVESYKHCYHPTFNSEGWEQMSEVINYFIGLDLRDTSNTEDKDDILKGIID